MMIWSVVRGRSSGGAASTDPATDRLPVEGVGKLTTAAYIADRRSGEDFRLFRGRVI
jgi:hypothetical protein